MHEYSIRGDVIINRMSNDHEPTPAADEVATPEPVVEAAPAAVVEETPAPAPAPAPEHKPEPAPAQQKTGKTRTPSRPGAVVGLTDKDPVSLAACVIKNKFNRKSLSVHHVQRRLEELGYRDAGTDKDGWYGDLTVMAVKEFQSDEGLDATGAVDMRTLEALFHDDPNVTVTE